MHVSVQRVTDGPASSGGDPGEEGFVVDTWSL